MESGIDEFKYSLVRISNGDGAPVGAGFLVSDEGHVLTCAHVVAGALSIDADANEKPHDTIHLDFPFLESAACTAQVEYWHPRSGVNTDPSGDIAVLKLTSALPDGSSLARLSTTKDLFGHEFSSYGYPAGYDAGVWAYGVVRDPLGNGWLQVEDTKESGRKIEQGFSGSPVLDQETNLIVGMVVATTTDKTGKVGFVVPTEILTRTWPQIRVDEPADSTVKQDSEVQSYCSAFVNFYSQIEVPGTNLSGSVDQLFFWPTLQESRLEDIRVADQESEDPRYQLSSKRGSIDLRSFPNSTLERAVIVAGAGFGKTALLSAVGYRLGRSQWLPALIPLPDLADSEETIIEFLNNHVNRRFHATLEWDRYCADRRAVLLFDGLDELPPGERRRVLGLVQDFSSSYDKVPWLLTVRDAKALAAPVDAKVLTIDTFDDSQIRDFAEAYRDAGSAIDVTELASQLRAYPDLRLLTRIPLFLALLLATARPSEPLPRNRSELLEQYLHIVLHPEEYKPTVSLDIEPMELRGAAEHLAFGALKRGKTRLNEPEIAEILEELSLKGRLADYISDLVVCGLLQRSAQWLNFAFPILQEYLAGRYLVTNCPDEVVSRFELVARRPWAQSLQFAMEQHPGADGVIGELIEQPDDAFGTVLRLLGQCVVNGANVSATTKSQLGELIGALWLSLPYPLNDNVGKLLAHGFTSPLPKSVRTQLEQGRGLTSSGYEVVATCEDPELTQRVLTAILGQDLELSSSYLQEMQGVVDDIAPTALQLYVNRIKAEHTTESEIRSLASLIQSLSSEHLPPEAHEIVTNDTNLPSLVRLAGYFLGPQPFPEEALMLAEEILRTPETDRSGPPGWNKAVDALWCSVDPVERWLRLMCDESLPEKRRDALLFALLSSQLETTDQINALRRLQETEWLTTDLTHTDLLLKAYLGQHGIISEIADSLEDLSIENLYLWAQLIGQDPSEQSVVESLQKLSNLFLSPEQKVQLSNALAFGLRFDVEMMPSRGSFVGRTERLHPAASEGARTAWEWANSCDDDVAVILPLLYAAVELGHREAVDWLKDILTYVVQYQPELFQDSNFDQRVSNALHALADWHAGRGSLPLSTLVRFVEVSASDSKGSASTSNAGHQAVLIITSLGNEEAFEVLMQLHDTISNPFIQGTIETSIDELAGRLGIRVIRDGSRLLRA